jgi:hypothetical protein
MRLAVIHQKTCRIVMRWPWHTRDKTVDIILLVWLWDRFYYDLLFKSFESRYEFSDWCKVRLQ